MLDGWYCRSIANEAAAAEEEQQAQEESKCKKEYKFLKKKLKTLLYENECFQEALRASQKQLLIVTRDRNFLLDRLLQYEKVENSTSDSENTDSSDDTESPRNDSCKRKKIELSNINYGNGSLNVGSSSKVFTTVKRKRPLSRTPKSNINQPLVPLTSISASSNTMSDGHMTPEEVERHLQSRQSFIELVPERAPPTVPTEMFSNEPSLDSESNDVAELETSPSNIGDEVSIDMIAD
ncbi:uncharacterized protein LOC108737604 isoform X2 [Agrilus planipennis]|uniref:Uncharacterized protein LOC108737604 isoform X2 n=1 Tax=Agrilus planipennis TaxID=224129 RepID=A0A1W4X0Y6_AGRPL|nr:uncharacterized protein LOC108737604 isoform X2 [Agrilus planipennis]